MERETQKSNSATANDTQEVFVVEAFAVFHKIHEGIQNSIGAARLLALEKLITVIAEYSQGAWSKHVFFVEKSSSHYQHLITGEVNVT